MDKRNLILDTLEELLREQKGATCSVSDIAARAGIAKGGMYYYFSSKEDVFDALVDRIYAGIIDRCRDIAAEEGVDALEKLERLYRRYRSSIVSSDVDAYLHQASNAAIHQKSLATILESLSPLIRRIIEQGIEEGVFRCSYPQQLSDILLSVFCFLLDPGIFPWEPARQLSTLKALADLAEKGLDAPPGSLAFLYS